MISSNYALVEYLTNKKRKDLQVSQEELRLKFSGYDYLPKACKNAINRKITNMQFATIFARAHGIEGLSVDDRRGFTTATQAEIASKAILGEA